MKGKELLEYLAKVNATIEELGSQQMLQLSMTQDIGTEGKSVSLVTYQTGDKALLIDGELYKMEIMLYKWNPNGKETNHSIKELKMEILDYGISSIEVI